MRTNPDTVDVFDPVGLPLHAGFGDGPLAIPVSESVDRPPLPAILAQQQELLAELNRLRAERDRWGEQQREIMKLLGSRSPDRIVHDLRNVLNERELFRSLADLGE